MKNLDKLLTRDSAFTTEEANSNGISNERLRLLIKQEKIERVGYGVYLPSNAPNDEMYSFQKRRDFVYSHETALYLHDLTDRDPLNYVCTVKQGYNSRTLKEAGFDIYYIKKDFYDLGIVEVKTVFGHKVKAYSMERTICDILRSRNRMDKGIIINAFKKYSIRKDKDLHQLMKYAQHFGVLQRARDYLDVLL